MVNKVDQKSAFYANGYHSTLIYKYVNKLNYLSTWNPTLEVKHICQRDPVTTESGRNGLDFKKIT